MDIWVVMGGMSAERAVSLDTGQAVAVALGRAGHRVWAYDLRDGTYPKELGSRGAPQPGAPVATRAGAGWAELLLANAAWHRDAGAELAFLALHGEEGENGTVQAFLDSVGFPYTGSGPTASAVAMDKALTKRIMEAMAIPTPPWALLAVASGAIRPGAASSEAQLPPLGALAGSAVDGLPVVVKPVALGSSVGVTIVTEQEGWEPALREAAQASDGENRTSIQLIVEKYIPGRELTVGILAEAALPVVEIRPRRGFYDYARKYTPGETEYDVPANLPPETAQRITEQSVALFRTIGCQGVARVDYRLSPEGREHCLELNTIPGLTSTSLIPKAAAAVGMDFAGLLEEICRDALRRRGHRV